MEVLGNLSYLFNSQICLPYPWTWLNLPQNSRLPFGEMCHSVIICLVLASLPQSKLQQSTGHARCNHSDALNLGTLQMFDERVLTGWLVGRCRLCSQWKGPREEGGVSSSVPLLLRDPRQGLPPENELRCCLDVLCKCKIMNSYSTGAL